MSVCKPDYALSLGAFSNLHVDEVLKIFNQHRKLQIELEQGDLLTMDYSSALFFGLKDVKVIVFQHLTYRKDYTDPEGEFRYVTMDRKMISPKNVESALQLFYVYISGVTSGKPAPIKSLTRKQVYAL